MHPASCFHHRLSLAAVLSLVTFGLTTHAGAEVIATDTFTATGTRTVGSAVAGTATEGGSAGLNWAGDAGFLIDDNVTTPSGGDGDGRMRTQGSSSIGIGLPFSFATYQQHGDEVRMTFESFYRTPSGGSGLWFGLSSQSATLNSTVGSVWFQVDPADDTWTFRSNATSANNGLQTSGNLPGTIAGSDWATYSFTYDNASQKLVDFSINGTSVVSDFALPNAPGSIDHAVIFAQFPYATATGSGFDNFQLEVIPEPGTFSLLGMAAAGLLWRRRH